ncbi:hypothetical protein EUTSA_v10015623mg [Eutrema salsugineum]|uniref:MADS-box domain-containing protein n=1 Tax=Eutrema salsugineum TaxID=72664 RepID=V4LKM1_EUTSA|nr:agamous-like MADS-box protein AGL97 [Eutrema salsugineum]ESQ40373.1 hypothetical protein EUTSA_v10015623mg [Eutrema salsugineum]
MVGMKRKISMEKIEKKDSRSVAFSKRRNGLYSKTSELCLLSGAQVAILATPISSKSKVSFYSFGHSSVDNVVSAFLKKQRPQEDLGLGFWWEDESLAKSEDTKELSDAVGSMSRMLQNLKVLHSVAVENREDMKKKDVVIQETHQELDRDQTLNLQSTTCASSCTHDDPPADFEGLVKNSGEEDQTILAMSDINNNDNNGLVLGNLDGWDQELDLDQIFDFMTSSEGLSMNMEMDDVSTNRNSCSDSVAYEDGAMVIHSNSDQTVATSDKNENNINALPVDHLDGCNQELDLDQIFDYMTSSEGMSMNLEMDDISMMMNTYQNLCSGSEAVEDIEAVVLDRDLDEDNPHLSDYFNELTSITAL